MERCAPVVCTGGPDKLAKLPKRSVSPPRADKEVSALSAAGLDSNCARGMAAASGFESELFVEVDDDDAPPPPPLVAALPPDDEVPLLLDDEKFALSSPPPLGLLPSSWAKFAFCSSTLWEGWNFVSRIGFQGGLVHFLGG